MIKDLQLEPIMPTYMKEWLTYRIGYEAAQRRHNLFCQIPEIIVKSCLWCTNDFSTDWLDNLSSNGRTCMLLFLLKPHPSSSVSQCIAHYRASSGGASFAPQVPGGFLDPGLEELLRWGLCPNSSSCIFWIFFVSPAPEQLFFLNVRYILFTTLHLTRQSTFFYWTFWSVWRHSSTPH